MNIYQSKSLFRAFADETRLRILNLLTKGELCVCDVMKVLKQPQSKVSRHFAYLKRTGLVVARKNGIWMYYRLSVGHSKVYQSLFKVLEVTGAELKELKDDRSELVRKRRSLVACCK